MNELEQAAPRARSGRHAGATRNPRKQAKQEQTWISVQSGDGFSRNTVLHVRYTHFIKLKFNPSNGTSFRYYYNWYVSAKKQLFLQNVTVLDEIWIFVFSLEACEIHGAIDDAAALIVMNMPIYPPAVPTCGCIADVQSPESIHDCRQNASAVRGGQLFRVQSGSQDRPCSQAAKRRSPHPVADACTHSCRHSIPSLVSTAASSLNPVDWKSLDWNTNRIGGFDFAGEIVELPPDDASGAKGELVLFSLIRVVGLH
jgi:hypothetical protein